MNMWVFIIRLSGWGSMIVEADNVENTLWPQSQSWHPSLFLICVKAQKSPLTYSSIIIGQNSFLYISAISLYRTLWNIHMVWEKKLMMNIRGGVLCSWKIIPQQDYSPKAFPCIVCFCWFRVLEQVSSSLYNWIIALQWRESGVQI